MLFITERERETKRELPKIDRDEVKRREGFREG
jgi:hypothetical protein